MLGMMTSPTYILHLGNHLVLMHIPLFDGARSLKCIMLAVLAALEVLLSFLSLRRQQMNLPLLFLPIVSGLKAVTTLSRFVVLGMRAGAKCGVEHTSPPSSSTTCGVAVCFAGFSVIRMTSMSGTMICCVLRHGVDDRSPGEHIQRQVSAPCDPAEEKWLVCASVMQQQQGPLDPQSIFLLLQLDGLKMVWYRFCQRLTDAIKSSSSGHLHTNFKL